jgi:hypothetical protein
LGWKRQAIRCWEPKIKPIDGAIRQESPPTLAPGVCAAAGDADADAAASATSNDAVRCFDMSGIPALGFIRSIKHKRLARSRPVHRTEASANKRSSKQRHTNSRQIAGALIRRRILRHFGGSPKYRRICIELEPWLLTIGIPIAMIHLAVFLIHGAPRHGPLLAVLVIDVKHQPFGHSIWRTKMVKTFFAISVVILLSTTSGMAQSTAMKACASDVKSLCGSIQPGDGRIKACIKLHFGDVSAPCQAVLTKAAAISKACGTDVKKTCADVKPGGGRVEACMKSHLSELSDPCKDAVSQTTAGKS